MNSKERFVNIAIIGKGNVGSALAAVLARSGHQVVFGVRRPGAEAGDERPVAEAIAAARAVILAVPFDSARDVLRDAGPLGGKIVIDATNPLAMGEDGLRLTLGFSTSGAEQIAELAPGAFVFKAFNQTGFENMADARRYPVRPVMFVAGDDPGGKQIVLTLVKDAGFDAVDIGGLRQSRLLEPFAMLWIELARKGGHGAGFAFALQRKPRAS
jgi:predicted dinucleotide-binding enzyme